MFNVMSVIVTNLDTNHLHIIAQAVLRRLLQIKGWVNFKNSKSHANESSYDCIIIFKNDM